MGELGNFSTLYDWSILERFELFWGRILKKRVLGLKKEKRVLGIEGVFQQNHVRTIPGPL